MTAGVSDWKQVEMKGLFYLNSVYLLFLMENRRDNEQRKRVGALPSEDSAAPDCAGGGGVSERGKMQDSLGNTKLGFQKVWDFLKKEY